MFKLLAIPFGNDSLKPTNTHEHEHTEGEKDPTIYKASDGQHQENPRVLTDYNLPVWTNLTIQPICTHPKNETLPLPEWFPVPQYHRHSHHRVRYHRHVIRSGENHGDGTCADSPCRVETAAAAAAPFQGWEAAGEVLFQEQAEGEVALDQAQVVEEELCRARGAAVVVLCREQEVELYRAPGAVEEARFQESGEVEEAVFPGLVAAEQVGRAQAVAEVVPCRARVEEEEDLGPELAAAAELPGSRVQEAAAAQVFRARGAAVGQAGPELEVEVAPVGRAQEAAEAVGRKEVEVVVVLGSSPCLVGVLDRDQDWCPGRQEARPGRRHDRPLSHRPR